MVATPIGNLGDISGRALDTLSSVDIIAAEDTRRSGLMLSRLGIKKPLISYYKEKEKSRAVLIVDRLKEGKTVALISDAGTPCVSDPGAELVRLAREEGIPVSPIPGACAATAAFSVSGIGGNGFGGCGKHENGEREYESDGGKCGNGGRGEGLSGYVFIGFLPRKAKDRKSLIGAFVSSPLPLIFYSAPHDAQKDLEFLYGELGARRVYIMREMTKIYEEIITGVLGELLLENPKGEFVVIVEGAGFAPPPSNLTEEEELAELLAGGMSSKEAVKTVAKNRKTAKDVIYKKYSTMKKNDE